MLESALQSIKKVNQEGDTVKMLCEIAQAHATKKLAIGLHTHPLYSLFKCYVV